MTLTTELNWQATQRERLFFTWSTQAGAEGPPQGFEIVDAKGAKFLSPDGVWRWDLESQVYNVNAGHKHPHIIERMKAQLDAVPACAPHALLPVRAELGGALADLTGLHRAFLTCGGSEAVENAIKIARLVTGRKQVITRRNSYHGATLAVLGIAGDARKAPFAQHLEAGLHIEDPYPAREATTESPSDWVESLESVLASTGPETVAAILLEGFTGTNGMQTPPADFWPRVRELCDAHGILLIVDEIFSGFGRTGKWFARDHWGVPVEMMTIGKGLTSGYAPLAGVMVSEAIARHFESQPLVCGLTHYAHPVSCAAALGSIDVITRERLVENAAEQGARLGAHLDAIVAKHGVVKGQRGLGLMRALELDKPAKPLTERLWEAGAFVPCRDNMLWLCPPLCIESTGVDAVAEMLDGVIGAWA